jgi:hypothetical protein
MGEFARGDEIAVDVSEDGESLDFRAVSHSSAQ